MTTTLHRLVLIAGWLAIAGVTTSANADTVAWWRFEEGAPGSAATGAGSVLDHSGNGHHGTPLNGATYAEGGYNCGDGASMAFDGLASRVIVPDHPAFELTQSLTIEAVLSTSGYAPTLFGVNQIVFRGDDRGGNDPISLGLRSDGHIEFFINNIPVVATLVTVPLASRTHVAVTLDNTSREVRLYLDKVVVGTGLAEVGPVGPLTGDNPGIGLGNLAGAGDQGFLGSLHEVRISNDVLTVSQMLSDCPADFNCNATTDVPDIFTFLAGWFTGDVVLANFNRDCCVNVADIFAFLAAWFAGCD
jgi:hypothetical protein